MRIDGYVLSSDQFGPGDRPRTTINPPTQLTAERRDEKPTKALKGRTYAV
ncbi:MAG: hypothetical protein AAFY26_23060 [Cyanobacteria bacterium J06638_22]